MFKIGDEVTIKPGSMFYREYDTSNPCRVKGIVSTIPTETSNWFYVKWETGMMNVYEEKDLIYWNESKHLRFCEIKDLED